MQTAFLDQTFKSKDTTSQDPAGLGYANKLICKYGAGGVSSDGCVDVGTDGIITFIGLCDPHHLQWTLRVGRDTPSTLAHLVLWAEISVDDGVTFNQVTDGDVLTFTLDTSNDVVTYILAGDTTGALPLNAQIRLCLARDESGADDGGLRPFTPTGTLSVINPVASAMFEIYHRKVI